MICPSCANEFLQPFVCVTCGAQKLHDHTLEALEKENAELREKLATIRAATTEECAEPVAVVYVADPIPDGTHGRWMSWLVNPVNLANNTKLYASAPDLEAKVAAAKLEIEQLRWYGNKDCTHQADEELRRLGYPL